MKNPLCSTVSFALIAAFFVASSGCSKSSDEITPASTPPQPKDAAAQLQQAFGSANSDIKTAANAASEGLRTANYEQALQSLQSLQSRQNLTLEQGTAVYNSELSLEAKLIAGVDAGDPNAIRAYEQLKKNRRR